jgi:hypothetical protein
VLVQIAAPDVDDERHPRLDGGDMRKFTSGPRITPLV